MNAVWRRITVTVLSLLVFSRQCLPAIAGPETSVEAALKSINLAKKSEGISLSNTQETANNAFNQTTDNCSCQCDDIQAGNRDFSWILASAMLPGLRGFTKSQDVSVNDRSPAATPAGSATRKKTELSRSTNVDKTMDDAIQSAGKSGSSARQTLTTVLVSGSESGAQSWSKTFDNNVHREKGDKAIAIPDLSNLPPEKQAALKLKSARALIDLGKVKPLDNSELTALAIALAEAREKIRQNQASENDVNLAKTIGEFLHGVFHQDGVYFDKLAESEKVRLARQTESALRALYTAIELGVPGASLLAPDYIRGARSDSNAYLPSTWDRFGGGVGKDFKNQVEQLTKMARDGNHAAIQILAAITGGAGSRNIHANEEKRDIKGYKIGPSNQLAAAAQRELIELTESHPELRDTVIRALSSSPELMGGDSKLRMSTLGKILAQDPSNVPDYARKALHAALESRLPPEHKAAVSGLMELAENWNDTDVWALKRHVSPEIAEQIAKNLHRINPETAQKLLRYLRLDTRSGSENHRTNALNAMADLGARYAAADDIAAIQRFAGPKSLQDLASQLTPNTGNAAADQKKGVENAKNFQRAAARLLLTIAEKASDPALQTAAFNAFQNGDWGINLQEDEEFRERLSKLQKGKTNNLAISSGVPKSAYFMAAPSGPAIYSGKGANIPDNALKNLYDLAVKNYGEGKVKTIADRIALFNSLLPEVRRQLSGSCFDLNEQGEEPQFLTLNGRVVDAKTFSMLPPEVRLSLTGSREKLPESQKLDLTGKVVKATEFNYFPPELRKQITGSREPMETRSGANAASITVPLQLLQGKSIDAETFNKLPFDVRESLSNGKFILLEEGMKVVPDLHNRGLEAEQFNSLPKHIRAAIAGSSADMPPGSYLSLNGQSINAATFNAMPPGVKRALIGSDTNLPNGFILKDLSVLTIDAKTFNRLPCDVRRALAGVKDRIDPGTALAQMAFKTIEAKDSPLSFLIDDENSLENKVELLKETTEAQLNSAEKELRDLTYLQDFAMKKLGDDASKGKFDRILAKMFGEEAQFGDAYDSNQVKNLVTLGLVQQRIQEKLAELQKIRAHSEAIKIAVDARLFSELMAQGKTDQADKLAMQMFAKYGMTLQYLAPEVADALFRNDRLSVWARMQAAGIARFKEFPYIDAADQRQAAKQAIKLLNDMDAVGDNELRKRMLDTDALRRYALAIIDQDPAVRELMDKFHKIDGHMKAISTQLAAHGTKSEAWVDEAKRRGEEIRKLLDAIGKDPQLLPKAREQRDALKAALSDGKSLILDLDTRKALKERLDALNSVLSFVDKAAPNYFNKDRKFQVELRIERLGKVQDLLKSGKDWGDSVNKAREMHVDVSDLMVPGWATSKVIVQNNMELKRLEAELKVMNGPNGYNRLDEMLKKLESKEFNADTFANWWKSDGALLAVAIGVTVIVVTIATAGSATPFVVAVLGTGTFMTTAELMREYQFNKGIRDHGARIMEWKRGALVENSDGTKRQMAFGRDVYLPYVAEFFTTLGTMYVTSALGSKLVKGLTDAFKGMTPEAQAVFVAQNRGLFSQLSSRALALESMVLKNPSLRTFVNQVVTGMARDSVMQGAAMGGEQGTLAASRRLGLELNEGNHVLGFVLWTLISAGHTGMHMAVAPRKASGTPGSANAQKHNLAIEFWTESPAQERAFFRQAELRGSKVEQTKNGYRETTKHGHEIEYIKTAKETVLADQMAASGEQVDALKPAEQKPASESKAKESVLAQSLRDKLEKLSEPLRAKERELTEAQKQAYAEREKWTKRIDDQSISDMEAERLIEQEHQALSELDQKISKLKGEVAKAKEQVESDSNYRATNIALATENGFFPPGEYFPSVSGKRGTKVYVGRKVVTNEGGKLTTKDIGDPVPVKVVEEALAALAKAGIEPPSITIKNDQSNSAGSLNTKTYDMTINSDGSGEPVRFIVYHEGGHLYFERVDHMISPEARASIDSAYCNGLRHSLDFIFDFQGKKNPSGAERTALFEEMKNKNNFFWGGETRPQDYGKYLVAKGELLAEMFKLYQLKKSRMEAGGKEPTYKELLKDFTEPHNQNRAKVMENFGELFVALEKGVFKPLEGTQINGSGGRRPTKEGIVAQVKEHEFIQGQEKTSARTVVEQLEALARPSSEQIEQLVKARSEYLDQMKNAASQERRQLEQLERAANRDLPPSKELEELRDRHADTLKELAQYKRKLAQSLEKLENTSTRSEQQERAYNSGKPVLRELVEILGSERNALIDRLVKDTPTTKEVARGGDATENFIFKELQELMDKPIIGGKTPRELGLRLIRLNAKHGNAFDQVGGDFALIKKNGEYIPLDATQSSTQGSKLDLPPIRKQNVIDAPLPNTDLKGAQIEASVRERKGLVASQFAEIATKFHKQGSPLNLLETPIPARGSEEGIGNARISQNERLRLIENIKNPGERLVEILSWKNGVVEQKAALEKFVQDMEKLANALEAEKNYEGAARLREYAKHTSNGTLFRANNLLRRDLTPLEQKTRKQLAGGDDVHSLKSVEVEAMSKASENGAPSVDKPSSKQSETVPGDRAKVKEDGGIDADKLIKQLSERVTPEALEELKSFSNKELPSLEGDALVREIRLEQLKWVAEAAKELPLAQASDLVEIFAAAPLLTAALKAGVRGKIKDGNLAVFSHGTTERRAREYFQEQVDSLSPTGGSHNGKFHTTPMLGRAIDYAMAAARDAKKNRPDAQGAVIGLAMPQTLAEKLQKLGLMTYGKDNGIEHKELVLHPEAYRILQSEPYRDQVIFFPIKTLK